MTTAAVFGASGLVGSTVAATLAQVPEITQVHLFDLDKGRVDIEAMDVAMIAEKMRPQSIQVTGHGVDMRDVDALAAAIDDIRPDVMINAAIPRNWYSFPARFEPEVWRKLNLEAKMGPWLPLFLVLPMKLMQARQASGVDAAVVQISYPDAVNATLAAVGLAPDAGCGNSQNINTVMRIVAARQLKVPVRDVTVQLVANHFHAWALAADAPEMERRPMYYSIFRLQEDVTDVVDTPEYWSEVRRLYPRQRPAFAATSAVQNAVRLTRADATTGHVNSPGGLIGGVEARLGRGTVEVVWPQGLTPSDGLALLATAQQGDGIAGISAEGDVSFVPECAEAMRTYLGYDCDVLRFADVEARADELIERLPSP